MKKSKLLITSLLGSLILASCTQTSTPTVSDSTGTDTPSVSLSEDEILDKALKTLMDPSIVLSGELNIVFYYAGTTNVLESYKNDQITAFGPDYYYGYYEELITPTDGSSPYIYSYDGSYFSDEEGYLISKELYPDNIVYISYIVDSTTGSYLSFEPYMSPFQYLTKNNLELTDEGVAIVNLTDALAAELSSQITWYDDIPFDSLVFSLDENYELSGGTFIGYDDNISYETSTGTTIQLDSDSTYTFDLIDISETNFRYPEAFEAKEGDANLDALFNDLAKGNYTMDIHRQSSMTGAQNFSYKCYYQENLILRYTADAATGISGTGWYNPDETEEGIVQISYSEDESGNVTLSGTGIEAAEYKITEYVSGFTFSAAVFDHNADGSYTLKSGYGFDDYIQYTAPDFAWNMTDYLYYYVDGSLNIKIGDNNDATFTYQYSYYYYGELVVGTITLDIYDIGTTDLKFTYNPYVAPDYSTWAGYGEDTVSCIESFFGEDALSFFPAIDPNTAYSFTPFETRYNNDTPYGFFLAIYNSVTDALNVVTPYLRALEEAGWTITTSTEGGNTYYDAKYELADGSGYYSLRITISTRFLYIFIYEFTAAPANDLEAFLIDNFGSSANCTLTYEEHSTYYKLNSSTNEYEYNSEDTRTKLITVIDGDKVKSENEIKSLSNTVTYFVAESDGVKYYTSNPDDEGATMILQNTYSSYKTIKSYLTSAGHRGIIYPLSLTSYAKVLVQDATDPLTYNAPTEDIAFDLYAAAQGYSSSDSWYTETKKTIDNYDYAAIATIVNSTDTSGNATQDLEISISRTGYNTSSLGSWRTVFEIKITITDIGTSSVTLPAVYTEAA